MKPLNSNNKPAILGTLAQYRILIITLILNLGIFIGWYGYSQNHHSESSALSSASPSPSNQEQEQGLKAKNIPLPAFEIELISQKTPELAHPASSTAPPPIPSSLPTLREPNQTGTIAETAPTPISLTKIVKLPPKESLSHSHSSHDTINGSNSKAATHTTTLPQPSTSRLSNSPLAHSPSDPILTDRDIPAQGRVVTPVSPHTKHEWDTRNNRELEAKTAQLSDAINQVKRLNQQAIDKNTVSNPHN